MKSHDHLPPPPQNKKKGSLGLFSLVGIACVTQKNMADRLLNFEDFGSNESQPGTSLIDENL